MAGGAGRRGIIVDTHYPGVGVEVHFLNVREVGIAMFGFLVDLFLRMIGAEMTFGASFGLASLRLGKEVAGVTGIAGTQ